MHGENLKSSRKLLFTALSIDIFVAAIVAISAFWAIDVLKDIQSGAQSYSPPLGDRLQLWEHFGKLLYLTLIGVGLALVKWLNNCYRFAKNSIGASDLKNEGWTAWAWIVPIINLFKPYQTINEIYKASAPGYRNPDDWKKESGSGLLLTWWIFWVVTHLLFVMVLNAMRSKATLDTPTLPQALGLLNLQIGVCVFSIAIAVMWFFVVNHLTGRLLARQRVSDDGMGKSNATLATSNFGDISATTQRHALAPVGAAFSKADSYTQAHPTRTPPVLGLQIEKPQPAIKTDTEVVNEEDLWAIAMAELEAGKRRPGLWAKAFAESEGDETKGKVAYLKSRVQQLTEAGRALNFERESQLREAAEKEHADTKVRRRNLFFLQQEFKSKVGLAPEQLKVLVRESEVLTLKELSNSRTGDTLLHACAELDLLEEVDKLLKAGAYPQQPNNSGKRPEFMTTDWATRLLLNGTTITLQALKNALELGITYQNDCFCYKKYRFQKFEDALAYASVASRMPQIE